MTTVNSKSTSNEKDAITVGGSRSCVKSTTGPTNLYSVGEAVGMSVGTVFQEVLQHNVQGRNSPAWSGMQLMGLLEIALKEALIVHVENVDWGIFVEKFGQSFITTYETLKTVRGGPRTRLGSARRRKPSRELRTWVGS